MSTDMKMLIVVVGLILVFAIVLPLFAKGKKSGSPDEKETKTTGSTDKA